MVGGSAAAIGAVDADVGGTRSLDFHRRRTVDRDSYRDAVGSSESLLMDGRRPSRTVDTQLLLSAVLAQLRYITANLRRHCRRAEAKDEWKMIRSQVYVLRGGGIRTVDTADCIRQADNVR